MIYGYIRVSTDHQTVENQRFEIIRFCKKKNVKIDGWIEETISGCKDYSERKLGELLGGVQHGDIIICAELSRLGRNLFMIMEILNICMTKECRVWTIKEGYRLGDDIQSKVLAFAFALSADIERSLISQRTKEALHLRRCSGTHLGRPFGSQTTNERTRLFNKREIITEMLALKIPKSVICDACNISRQTLYIHLRRGEFDFERKSEIAHFER